MRLRVFLFGFLLSRAAQAQTSPEPVRAVLPLRSVTVALNQAELEHRGSVNLPAGRSTVWLEGVASSFGGESLQVEASDNAQVLTVGSEAVRPPAGRTPTDSLNLLDARVRRLDAEVKALEEERNFLLANRTLPTGMQAGWSTELQKGAAFLRTRLPDIQTQMETLAARRQQLGNRCNLLANGTTTGPARLRVVLEVELAKPGAVGLTLRYVNGNCLWELRPEIRVPESGRKLIVNSFAKVSNGSGLEWTNVQLRLKNEEVEQDVTKPDLTPWAMNFRRSTGGEGRVDKFVVKGNANGKAATEPSSVYTVPEPVSIGPADDYLVRLAEQALPARPEYVTIPKLSGKVFLQAKVAGWEGLFLPDEEFSANVYYAGAYVGETEIDPRAFNDSLEISLGHDNLITVGRTKTQDFNGKAGLNGQLRTQLTYEINVRNRHAQPVQVRVLDQIPVSQESDLKVKLESADGAQLDEASGRLTWLLNLGAGASKRVRFTFTVEYPKDKTVDFQRPRNIRSPKFR